MQVQKHHFRLGQFARKDVLACWAARPVDGADPSGLFSLVFSSIRAQAEHTMVEAGIGFGQLLQPGEESLALQVLDDRFP